MTILREAAGVVLMGLGILGWIAIGLLALLLAPFLIGMVGIAAALVQPDMDGY